MSKVYIVTGGYYDDLDLVAAFSTEEKAKEFRSKNVGMYNELIEELDLDPKYEEPHGEC